MYKKIKVFFLGVLSFLMCNSVYAACDIAQMNQLNTDAIKVKADYKIAVRIMDPSEYDYPDGMEDGESYELKQMYFEISVYNLTEDLYIVVHNSVTGEDKTYTYQDTSNGVLTFNWDDVYTLVNYTIYVYSSNATNCANTKLHTIYVTTPRYNDYSSYGACKGAEKFYLCFPYITTETVDEAVFYKRVEEYKNGQINEQGEEKPIENNENKKGNYKTAIMVGIMTVIIVGGISTVVIVTKQRSKD